MQDRWYNSSHLNTSLHSNTLFWFPKQPVLFLLLIVITWRRSNTDQFHSLWTYPTENGIHNILQSMRDTIQQRDGIFKRKNYPSRALEFTPVFGGIRVAHLFSFCVFFRSEFHVVMSVTISASKRCSVRHYLLVFVRECMSYLHFLFVWV